MLDLDDVVLATRYPMSEKTNKSRTLIVGLYELPGSAPGYSSATRSQPQKS